MTFNEIWPRLKHGGAKIKRAEWKGYWVWQNDTIMIHCGDGTVLDIRETDDPSFTFSNVAATDWEVVTDTEETDRVKRRNMLKILKTRGTGKTTDLLRLAAENNCIVMEPTYAAKKYAEEKAKQMGYDNVRIVTAQEWRGMKGNFLVDELSWFLEQIGVVGYSETI